MIGPHIMVFLLHFKFEREIFSSIICYLVSAWILRFAYYSFQFEIVSLFLFVFNLFLEVEENEIG